MSHLWVTVQEWFISLASSRTGFFRVPGTLGTAMTNTFPSLVNVCDHSFHESLSIFFQHMLLFHSFFLPWTLWGLLVGFCSQDSSYGLLLWWSSLSLAVSSCCVPLPALVSALGTRGLTSYMPTIQICRLLFWVLARASLAVATCLPGC